MTTANSSFSPIIPRLQMAWDSTSMGTFKECPRKYYYSIVAGWQPRDMSVHLTFGLHYHAALERYHRLKAKGMDHAQALRATVKQALIDTWDAARQRPWSSDHKYKNRLTLIRTVVWYLNQFGPNDSIRTVIFADGSPAVELSFRFQTNVLGPDAQPYLICGHLDRLGELGGMIYGNDNKTTSWSLTPEFFEKYSPDNQMSTYSFAGKIVYHEPMRGMIVDAAQVLVTFSRFERGFAPRSEAQLDEWYEDWTYWVKMAEHFAIRSVNKQGDPAGAWPMNDKSCSHFGGCPFLSICSKDPAVREMWLKANFVHRTWDPLQIRGDI